MSKSGPPIHSKPIRITIICEGLEEYMLIKKYVSLHVWNSHITIKPVNAGSISKIPKMYKSFRRSNPYGLTLIFCDAGLNNVIQSRRDYETVISVVEEYGQDPSKIISYGNPCTMQIVLAHFTDQHIKSEQKSKNARLIEQCTGVKNYDGSLPKINELMRHITKDNYQIMKDNIKCLNKNYQTSNSTNFIELLVNLESDNIEWIQQYNELSHRITKN